MAFEYIGGLYLPRKLRENSATSNLPGHTQEVGSPREKDAFLQLQGHSSSIKHRENGLNVAYVIQGTFREEKYESYYFSGGFWSSVSSPSLTDLIRVSHLTALR